jgi:aryl-alcohol dehydrogenase-like predicted oxidoreductase
MELRGVNSRNPRPLDPADAERVLHQVLDAGINFVDTSLDYGDSEELIGRHLASRRDEYFLASKCGCPLDANTMLDAPPGPLPHDYSRANIVAGVDQSLGLLATDHLDVLQLHISPSVSVLEAEDTIATLLDIKAAGKTRFIGSSSTLPNFVDHIAMDVFDTFQVPYSALERLHEAPMADAAAAGAGIIVRGGIARGARGRYNDDQWDRWEAAGLDDLLDGMTRPEFVLRATIANPHVHTTIVGTLDPRHLADNLRTVTAGPLAADVVAEVHRRLDALP